MFSVQLNSYGSGRLTAQQF